MKVEESGGVYTSLETSEEGRRFEDVGLSICVSPLQILVLGFWRAEFQRSAVGPKVSRGVREIEETEEFVEVFNVIFKLRICPLSVQRLYTMTAGT